MRTFPKALVELIEDMALVKPPLSIAIIHRRLAGLAGKRGWSTLSYLLPTHEMTYRCRD